MYTRDIDTLAPETLEKMLQAIPFYKAVRKYSEEQYQELLQFSRIFHFESSDKIITRGQRDSWSYFLVKGQLVVSLPDHYGRPLHVNYITPGEVFGDLSVLLRSPRTADIYVDDNCREAVIFGTDFGAFGQLLDFNIISMETKLIYYRHAVSILRWKLEMYRSKYQHNDMANKHRRIKVYSGPKDSLDELNALYQQSIEFAKLLIEWNQVFGSLSFVDGKVPEPNIVL
ncbi:MAG: cyclic nucleotide-binding domain-containing protein [Cellvibrionaceae bacterium]|nr:cyclic nucleotide-binding domain-containing protein [Cellvibrionaceae bacterium]